MVSAVVLVGLLGLCVHVQAGAPAVSDPCSTLSSSSVCDERTHLCTALVWLDKERALFTENANGLLTNVAKPITCAEAASFGSGFVPLPHAFDEASFRQLCEEGEKILKTHLLHHFHTFPFVSKNELDDSYRILFSFLNSLLAGSSEALLVSKALCYSSIAPEIIMHMQMYSAWMFALPENEYYEASKIYWQLSLMFDKMDCHPPTGRGALPRRILTSKWIDLLHDPTQAVSTADSIMNFKSRTVKNALDQQSFDWLHSRLQVLTSPEFETARSSGSANIALHAFLFETELCPLIFQIVAALGRAKSPENERATFRFVQFCARVLAIQNVIQVSLMHARLPPRPFGPNGETSVPRQRQAPVVTAVLMMRHTIPKLGSIMTTHPDCMQSNALKATGTSIGMAFIYGLKVREPPSPSVIQLLRMFTDPRSVEAGIRNGSISKEQILAAKMLREGIAAAIGPLALSAFTVAQFESIYTPRN